jgi:hypothetical protein
MNLAGFLTCVTAVLVGRLSLTATQVAGHRTVFRGTLNDSSDIVLAEFRTELDVRCAVHAPDGGGTESSTQDSHVLVYDNDLSSPFCSRFQWIL